MSVTAKFGGKNTIGILSDTHGSLPAWRSALKLFGDADMVLHAGDVLYHGPRNAIPGGYIPADLAEAVKSFRGRLFIARGNCDADIDQMVCGREFKGTVSLVWNGKKILMMHGENFPLFRQTALDMSADLAISGHTHVASVVRERDTIFLNPGSAAIPKGRDPASAAIADAEGISILTLDGGLLHRERW